MLLWTYSREIRSRLKSDLRLAKNTQGLINHALYLLYTEDDRFKHKLIHYKAMNLSQVCKQPLLYFSEE